MNRIIFCYILLICTYFTNAQPAMQVKDSTSFEPLAYAELLIKTLDKAQDTIQSHAITDTDGKHYLSALQTYISITIYYLGYTPKTIYNFTGTDTIIYLSGKATQLEEVVITGSFIPIQIKESFYDINIISRKSIDEKALNTVGEALNKELQFKTNNGHVNETAIMMNGLSGNHVKILVDGIPVEGRLNGNVDLSQIVLQDIDRIEVIDGPASVAYGTNALGGTINIITKKYQTQDWSTYIKAYYESIGQYNIDGSVGYRFDKNQIKINVGRHYFDGDNFDKNSRYKTWKPREQTFGSILYTRRIKSLQLSTIQDLFYEKMISRGAPSPPYFISAIDTYYKTYRYSSKLLLTGKINKNHYIDCAASYSLFNRLRNIYYKDLTSIQYYPTDGESDQDSTKYHAQMIRCIFIQQNDSAKVNFQIGMENKMDIIHAQRVYNNRQYINETALFGTLDYAPIIPLKLRGALRVTYNSAYKLSATPSLHVNYKPNENVVIKVSYAQGFRAPELKELFLEFHYNSTINLYGNPLLKPEKSHHLNFNIDIQKNWNDEKIILEHKLYFLKIKNRIGLQQVSDIDWKYYNFDYFSVWGFQAKYSYVHNWLSATLSYNCNANYNSTFDTYTIDNNYFYNHTLATSATLLYEKYKISMIVDYKYNGKLHNYYITDANEIINSSIGSYNILDISINKFFFKEKLNFSLGIKNVTNTRQVPVVGDIYGVSNQSDATALNVLWGRTYFSSVIFKL